MAEPLRKAAAAPQWAPARPARSRPPLYADVLRARPLTIRRLDNLRWVARQLLAFIGVVAACGAVILFSVAVAA